MPSKLRGYTLIIAEKPRAAAKIALALGLSKRYRLYGIPYWVGRVGNRAVVVAGVAGHLYTLSTKERGYPTINYEWIPRWYGDRNSKHLTNYFKLISSLARGAIEFINACDYDIEGSVIGYMIISKVGDLSKAKRMKFSSLTPDELRRAFNNLMPLDWNMIEAGLCRHELDWLWGINVSRALSEVFRKMYNERLILSAGRVQSPTLVEVVDSYVARATFVPDVKFSIRVNVRFNGKDYTLKNDFGYFDNIDIAKTVCDEIRRKGAIEVVDKVVSDEAIDPPPPFNLPDLQYEASRIYGYSPYKTLSVAEDLYLDSLISYPRTNSQKLPRGLDNRAIISSLGRIEEYRVLANELLNRKVLIPCEGDKDDPAHPAIYPTGYIPSRKLGPERMRLYDLIVRRYLASFADKSLVRKISYVLRFNDRLKFSLNGLNLISPGWIKFYPFYHIITKDVPPLKVGDVIEVSEVKLISVYSKAPSRYTKASLLRWMESVGIGTEATRAEIIETLFRRKYLKSSSKYIEVTDLGFYVAKIIKKFFNDLSNVELTRKFEELMNNIVMGRASRKEVVLNAKEFIRTNLSKFKAFIDGMDRNSIIGLLDMSVESKCNVCGNFAHKLVDGIWLCEYHYLAYKNIKDKYVVWRSRLGIEWSNYLARISRLPSTGKYCKEVAKYLVGLYRISN